MYIVNELRKLSCLFHVYLIAYYLNLHLGSLFRGESGVHEKFSERYKTGGRMVLYGFTSCTTTKDGLTNFGGHSGKRTGFQFEVRDGAYKIKLFSQFEDEDEVLLEPGCSFVIKQTINFDDPKDKDLF